MGKSPSLRVADVFHAGFARYQKAQAAIPMQHYKAVNALLSCHTPALGFHTMRCEHCGHEQHGYNSCRNRHCPSCQAGARAAWVEKRLSEALPVRYFHVVFTIPHQLNAIILRNKEVMYDILFRSVSETLLDLGRDEKHLGAELGFMAVLHTWGQNLLDHPHLHCLVPAGGLTRDATQWRACRYDGFLFPIEVVAALYRGKFMALFRDAVAEGKIKFHGQLRGYQQDARSLKNLLDVLYGTRWVVFIKEPFPTAERVVKYLSRYTHRTAIADSRLVAMDEETVRFRWRDYAAGGKQKEMVLRQEEFIRRFLLHVLPAGFMRIRYYGFLSNRNRRHKLPCCFALLREKMITAIACHAVALLAPKTAQRRLCCPACNRRALRLYAVTRRRLL